MRCIDPRVVIVQIVLMAACAFYVARPLASVVATTAICASLLYLGCVRQAAFLAMLTAAVNVACQLLLSWGSLGAANAFVVVLFLLRKATPLAGAAFLFLHGMSVSRLVAALSAWRCPRPLLLTLAIAYRFMPTIGYEVGMVKDALALRGRPLSAKSVVAHPREMAESVLVPLMMRSVHVADELAASAVARAVENPVARVCRMRLRMRAVDWAYLAFTAAAAACVLAVEWW